MWVRQNFTDLIALDRVECRVSFCCRFCCLMCTFDIGLGELCPVVQYFSGARNRIPVHRDKKYDRPTHFLSLLTFQH